MAPPPPPPPPEHCVDLLAPPPPPPPAPAVSMNISFKFNGFVHTVLDMYSLIIVPLYCDGE